MSERHLRLVVCAANRNRVTGEVAMGVRHFCPMMHANIDARTATGERDLDWARSEQGFIDQWGVFMDRREAWKVAEAAGQIRYPLPGQSGVLYSENLY